MSDFPGHMSIGQQIGQLLMVGFSGTSPTPEVLDLIQSGHVGGVILFSRNLRTPRQTLRLTTALQSAAQAAGHRLPLLIATDQENGIVRRTGTGTTLFPGNLALGAIGSADAVEEVARASGEELRAQGITMNLAPVVDIANNPDNPVIGVRSFGENPELVARLGEAAVRGFHLAGVAATIKHFPGHGDTSVDSHLALPTIPFSTKRLESVELVPFRHAIAAGTDAVMTAHVALPAVTGSASLPATLAPQVIHDLLRRQLGFDGVVITDCLEMHAISAGIGVACGAVRALQAGADIVLISHRHDRQMGGLAAIRTAVQQGDLATELIAASAQRVLRLKQRLMTWDDLPDPTGLKTLHSATRQRLAERLYAESITIVRDDAGLLPLELSAGSNVLVVWQNSQQKNQAADRGFDPAGFVVALRRELQHGTAVANVAVITLALPDGLDAEDIATLRQQASRANVVLLLTRNAHLPRQRAASQQTARALLATGRPLVGIAVCDPHDAMALPEIGTWLATYDYTLPALEAVARVVVGHAQATGKLPVTL